MIPIESEYYACEIYHDCYRVRDGEFEIYAGDGRWNIKKGLLADYQSGLETTLYPISDQEAQKRMEVCDNPDAGFTVEYTERHEKLLKRVFGENETLESMREKASDDSGEFFDIEGMLLPYISGTKGAEYDDVLADDLISLICDTDDDYEEDDE